MGIDDATFSFSSILLPLAGGMLIGSAAILLLLYYGRIFGVSGIIGSVIGRWNPAQAWRVALIAGLLVGGALVSWMSPLAMENSIERSPLLLIISGLLVGFGTRLGSGCTSGHGICGIGRMSMRSLIAVVTFMVAGMLVVALMRHFFGGVA